MRHHIVLTAAALLLAAPPAQAAEDYIVADAPPPPHHIEFLDQRPVKEIKGGLPLFFDPTYSVPDKRIKPGLLDLLGAALETRLGERLAGKQVTITRLQVQNYFMGTYRANQAVSLAITAGALAHATVVSVEKKEAIDAVIFRAVGSVDGKPFEVKSALQYVGGDVGMGMIYNGDAARATTKDVVSSGIVMTVDEIDRVTRESQ